MKTKTEIKTEIKSGLPIEHFKEQQRVFKQNRKLFNNANKKLNLLLIYSLHPTNKTVTLPEWIKEVIRLCYSDFIEVFACGPENEINISDGENFYNKVSRIVENNNIDILLDIEGGASSIDFMFKRFPIGITIPKAFWAIDTHQFLNLQREKAKYFDVILSAQKNAVSELPSSDSGNVYWMPAGASIHERDYQLNRDIDCAFVGSIVPTLHIKRKEIIDYLKVNIPNFQCFSNVFLEKKAGLSSRIKIMINQSLRNDLNFRIFESMACGCMVITDKLINNGLNDLFGEGKEIITFFSKEDLKDKIQYYLSHEEELKSIATAGQEKVLKYFTHNKIFQYIFNIIFQKFNNERKWV